MSVLKVIIEKSDVAYNTEAVGKDGKLIGIAEMAVDVELFGNRGGSSLGRHKAIGHLVGVNIRLVFIVSFEAADEGVKGFGVIFRNIKFNAGGIESKHMSKGAVNSLADGLGEIDHVLDHEFNVRKKVLFKACEKRSIGHLGEAAENP